ncbi:hypothetical protein ACFO4N_00090 [Camelliibacillus cellulosilyticus]|uniref:ABC-2 family transporter n=1 Tax=Camelliibacillus cellulosilyticus TaxID=2174486 RepID=A0ABV9GKD8_9BACL
MAHLIRKDLLLLFWSGHVVIVLLLLSFLTIFGIGYTAICCAFYSIIVLFNYDGGCQKYVSGLAIKRRKMVWARYLLLPVITVIYSSLALIFSRLMNILFSMHLSHPVFVFNEWMFTIAFILFAGAFYSASAVMNLRKLTFFICGFIGVVAGLTFSYWQQIVLYRSVIIYFLVIGVILYALSLWLSTAIYTKKDL